MEKWEHKSLYSGPITATTWQDKRRVNIVATNIYSEEARNQSNVELSSKPIAVVHYNKSMGGEDLADQKKILL